MTTNENKRSSDTVQQLRRKLARIERRLVLVRPQWRKNKTRPNLKALTGLVEQRNEVLKAIAVHTMKGLL